MFVLKVPRNVGQVDPAFTMTETQAKNARSALFKHQNSAVHKQAGLLQLDCHSITPVNLQLDKTAADHRSKVKQQQEKNRQILYHTINVIVVLVKTGHPLCGYCEGNDSHNKDLFLEMTHLLAQYDTILKSNLCQ